MFNDNEDDFMSTIKKEQEKDKIEKEENAMKQQITKLTEENKKLKFVNMDHETTIEDLKESIVEKDQKLLNLENQLKQLQDKVLQTELQLQQKITELQQNTNQNPTSQQQYDNISSPPISKPLSFANFNSGSPIVSNPNSAPGSPMPQPMNVDRSLLRKWKDWNVDMTTWRSVGSGPIVEF
ncbi:hypothetical protein TBLA_0B09420 [Henningerozyma blattae CBS 6284]|uniref:Uncharacterized protein n=1 Tax=Henningerozyma blattae (strain ATCC 34711 / CBS 6284 / DSM 70876 / NBRC 10599 / NRRL Y-10934 / UCD 77-7) TaxID=1071380 RepID=I2H057_HENB6|nr:hypothetical protein TBLA_0B09420 [Tetrapisispora blattae CBS 6284]CCH59759.1 hypothetical protein TBLA_0B09420 [Tetrapisispora blattae CBS 6284]